MIYLIFYKLLFMHSYICQVYLRIKASLECVATNQQVTRCTQCVRINSLKLFVVIYLLFSILPSVAWTSHKTVPVLLSLQPSHIFLFNLLPSPVHTTGFSFYVFTGFLATFILLSSSNNNFWRSFSCYTVLKTRNKHLQLIFAKSIWKV